VGAGATGVETAGALAELVHDVMPHVHPHLAVAGARVILVDLGHVVLGPFSDEAHGYAARQLQRRGVQLRLGISAREIGAGHVALSDGTTIPTHLTVWGGGLTAAPLAAGSGLSQGRGQLRDILHISQRPAEAADRAVPGHWEGDLVFGRRPSAVGTLVERHSRYVLLFPLPEGATAHQVRPALTAAVLRLPEQLRRSLTWDHGREMAEHVQFTVDSGVQVYFCDPRSPWQRGTNENTNGLLRQYLPKSSDLRRFDQTALDAIAAELNGRPRQTLGFKTPSEALAEALP
jgi:hypothetical protein